MRKFLFSLMAASVLVPAAGQAEDGGFLRALRNQAERSSQRDNSSDDSSVRSRSHRSERSDSDRPGRVERVPREDRAPRTERVQRVEQVDGEDRSVRRIERVRRADRDFQRVEQVEVPEPGQQTEQNERRRDGLAGAFGRVGSDIADGRSADREDHRDWRRDRDGRRYGDRDWRRDRDGRRDWRRDWRHDRRYDWYSYRNRYGSLFRLGRYYDPYGWGYRRFHIGFSLWPSYYGSSFWLDDPWRYRLPPAYGPYRWVRYYDDALLVNIYTGQVVDVVHNVFW